MARANRTAELLAAARLVDLELGREAEKTRRQSAQSQALASLIPELVQAGTSIAGKVQDYDLAQKKQAADIDYRASLAGLAERKVDLAEKKQTEPKPVTPFAENKEKRAQDEEARRQARFEEEQKKKSQGLEQERLTSLMNSDEGNDPRGRGVSAAELEASAEKTGVAPGAMLARIDTEAQKDEQQRAKMANAAEEMARKRANDAQRKLMNDAVLAEKKAAADERAKGKPLPAEVAQTRGLKVAGLNLVEELRKAKAKVGTGAFEGRAEEVFGALQDDPNWAEFKLLSNALLRTVGRVLEGGKMAAGDEAAYTNFLNNPSKLDEKEYDRVVDGMEWILNNDLDAFDANLQGYRLAGRPPRKAKANTLDPKTKLAQPSQTTADQDAAEVPGVVIEGP